MASTRGLTTSDPVKASVPPPWVADVVVSGGVVVDVDPLDDVDEVDEVDDVVLEVLVLVVGVVVVVVGVNAAAWTCTEVGPPCRRPCRSR